MKQLTTPPPGPLRYLHITHCAFAISDGSALILIDPFLSGQFEWRGIIEKHLETPAFKADQIPHVDAILISHEHMDHYDIATLKTLASRTKAKIYAPQIVIDDATKQHGMDRSRFIVVHRGQQFDVGKMHVTVFPAAESEKTEPVDRVGFLIESGGRSIYHQG